MVYLNLKPLLKKHGRTKYWLKELLSSNYTAINDMLEHRTTAISFKTMNILCKAFDCEPGDLFAYEDDDEC